MRTTIGLSATHGFTARTDRTRLTALLRHVHQELFGATTAAVPRKNDATAGSGVKMGLMRWIAQHGRATKRTHVLDLTADITNPPSFAMSTATATAVKMRKTAIAQRLAVDQLALSSATASVAIAIGDVTELRTAVTEETKWTVHTTKRRLNDWHWAARSIRPVRFTQSVSPKPCQTLWQLFKDILPNALHPNIVRPKNILSNSILVPKQFDPKCTTILLFCFQLPLSFLLKATSAKKNTRSTY